MFFYFLLQPLFEAFLAYFSYFHKILRAVPLNLASSHSCLTIPNLTTPWVTPATAEVTPVAIPVAVNPREIPKVNGAAIIPAMVRPPPTSPILEYVMDPMERIRACY